MEEYKKYLELHEKFINEVERISRIINGDNYYTEIFELSEELVEYMIEEKCNYPDKEHRSFPSSLLFKSEEEIIAWDNGIKEKERLKREEKERKEKQEAIERAEKSDRAQYERLKKKFENEQ